MHVDLVRSQRLSVASTASATDSTHPPGRSVVRRLYESGSLHVRAIQDEIPRTTGDISRSCLCLDPLL